MKPLNIRRYTDRGIFDQEQAQIFDKNWWLVGGMYQLQKPGDYLTATLGKLPIFVIRNKLGEIVGFHNVCRHRAGPMVNQTEGRCVGNLLVCQYHGWSYDYGGRLKNAHALNGTIDPAEFSLYPIRVETWNGMVFACVDQSTPQLDQWLGEIVDIAAQFPGVGAMVPHGTIDKTSPTNWKCYGENGCEGYHVGLVHSALSTTMNNDEVELSNHENGQFVGFNVRYAASASDPSRVGRGYWIYKFPGLLLHFSEYAFNAERVLPLAEDKIALKRWFWLLPDATEQRGIEPEQILNSASSVMDEDLGICESVYKNLQAGVYSPSVLSLEDEPGTGFFQALVRQSLPDNLISS